MLSDDLKQKVKTDCATYAGNGRCLLDRACPFFNAENESLPRCMYFETHVLPGDDRLHARYWQSFGLAYWGEGRSAKVCVECDKAFKAKSNRQKYCESCRAVVKSKQKSKQNAKYYRKQIRGDK